MSIQSLTPVAVVGMACRYPGAQNLLELWENVLARRQQFRQIPDARLPLHEYHAQDPGAPDKTYGTRAAVLDGFNFDPEYFRIPRSTFVATDVVHWLALSTALDAIKHAGLDLSLESRERAGVIVGNTLTGEETRTGTLRLRWPFVRKVFRRTAEARGLSHIESEIFETAMEELYKSVFPAISEDTLAGGLSNTIAGRICNYLDFHGGGFTVDGACSSSLLALATAADHLNQGKLDLAIAGGVDVSLDTFELIGFSKVTALTPGEMRVYDRRGNGFIPGEGCGMVVLKRLEDARRDHDPIYAVLRGWGISSDGRGGITAPNAKGQARALIRAYQGAGYAPQTLAFIEGHGTGTKVGDRIELEGVAEALAEFGAAAPHGIGITSFKSVFGHTKAAAGIGGFIKAAIAVNRRVIPPTAGCNEPHPSFSSTANSLYPVTNGAVNAPEKVLRAGVSAMGFGGINCHVTLESGDPPANDLAPNIPERSLLASSQQTEIFPLAAADVPALIEVCQRVRSQAQGLSVGELVDLAAHCALNLDKGAARAAVIAGSVDELIRRLDQLEHRLRADSVALRSLWHEDDLWVGYDVVANRVGFLFPGQGSQQPGMGRTLVERFAWAQAFVGEADRKLAAFRGEHDPDSIVKGSLSELFLASNERDPAKLKEPQQREQLTITAYAQPAICITSWLWNLRLQALGIKPMVTGGHSLGELTALAVAGVYRPGELVQLAATRGWAMSPTYCDTGTMGVIACDADTTLTILQSLDAGYCCIANHNSPRQTVISGVREAVRQAVELAKQQGLAAQLLPVGGAFHSRLVAPAAAVLRNSPHIPEASTKRRCRVFSSMQGNEIPLDFELRDHLSKQMISPVDFPRLVDAMARHCDWLVEVGPGRVLSNLVQQTVVPGAPQCLPVEARPGSDREFNAVVAEAFTRGLNLRWDQLYAQRLRRPFVPAAQRQFYVNPCEREFAEGPALSILKNMDRQTLHREDTLPAQVIAFDSERDGLQRLAVSSPSLRSPAANHEDVNNSTVVTLASDKSQHDYRDVRSVVTSLVGEYTGFNVAGLSDDARFIDDLNLDSIKVGALLSAAALRLNAVGKIDVFALTNATVGQVIAAFEGPLEAAGEPECPEEVLYRLIAERTGFSRESLQAEQRLLDDLNIDSIKAASMLAEFLTTTRTQDRVQVANLMNASLGEITACVLQAIANRSEQAEVAVKPAERSETSRWVRAFTRRKLCLSEDINGQIGRPLAAGSVLVLSAETSLFAPALAARLGATYTQSDRLLKLEQAEAFSTLVITMPDNVEQAVRTGEVAAMRALAMFGQIKQQTPGLWRALQTVVFVQRIGSFTDAPITAPAAGAFAASLHLERPELKVTVLDFAPEHDIEFVVHKLVWELGTEQRFRVLGYERGDGPCIERMSVIEPEDCKTRQLSWSSDDVILVTGGGKGITAECVFALARETGARLALIGRSRAPEPGEHSELASNLNRLRAAGVGFRYFEADVTNSESLTAVVQTVRAELGPITGVVHGAGINKPRPLADVSCDEACVEIGPKVLGAEHLLSLFADTPLKLFATLTSIIGITGMQHNAWYAYSNELVSRLMRGYAALHPDCAVVCYAFGVWEEVGMGVKLGSLSGLERQGIHAMTVAEGVEQFLRWTRLAPPDTEVIITASIGELATWCKKPAPPARHRFDGELLRFEAGVELVTRIELTTETDPYLKDHDFRGSLLFPTVMGLEAMAQSALRLLGLSDAKITTIESVRLTQPILVHREQATTIEIRALALERTSPEEPWVVETSIHTGQTGFGPAHFSARFIVSLTAKGANTVMVQRVINPLDIIPTEDLYGSVLFQGPLFQRICAIETLDNQRVLFLTQSRNQTSQAPEGFDESVKRPLVLGDAYYRDSLLQSPQLATTPAICLPVYIERIDLYGERSLDGIYRVDTSIVSQKDDRYIVEVKVYNMQGELVEHLAGYEVQTVEQRHDLPTAEALVARKNRPEERAFHNEIAALESAFGVVLPSTTLRRVTDVHGKRREVRRAIEIPVFYEAVRKAGLQHVLTTKDLDLNWLESGKPVFTSRRSGDGEMRLQSTAEHKKITSHSPDVSLSHDDDFVLCVAGTGPQGCDLIAEIQCGRDQWSTMLGTRHRHLLGLLEANGDSLDHAGMRIWSAMETAAKASGSSDSSLIIEDSNNQGVLFTADSKAGRFFIMTCRCRLGTKQEYIAAFNVRRSVDIPIAPKCVSPSVYRLKEVSQVDVIGEAKGCSGNDIATAANRLETAAFAEAVEAKNFLTIESQHENIERQFRFRVPLVFKDGANPDGTLHFVRCFDWMGRFREMALQPVLRSLLEEFTGRDLAWVTNRSFACFERPIFAGEMVEVVGRFLGYREGSEATVALGFDWFRTGHDQQRERVITSQIEMTWARVVAHGVVRPEPYPPYLREYFQQYGDACCMAGDEQATFAAAVADLGGALWQAEHRPDAGVVLGEDSVVTTQMDANLVGNVYYSKYYELQSTLIDTYLFAEVPEAYDLQASTGTHCIYTTVEHLRDAMPFDRILARMRLVGVYEHGLAFDFDFYRVNKTERQEKLAVGKQLIAWTTRAKPGTNTERRPVVVPQPLMDKLLHRVLAIGFDNERKTAA